MGMHGLFGTRKQLEQRIEQLERRLLALEKKREQEDMQWANFEEEIELSTGEITKWGPAWWE
jgi:chaperonin cofactor prefoldin